MILALVVLGLIVVGAAGYFILNSDFWLVKTITVVGNDHLTPKEVVALAGVDYKTNLLRLPGARIEADIRKSPWVEEVSLSRGLPNRLTITIRERKPFAGLKQGNTIFVMDKTGFVIRTTADLTETSMPVISEIKIGRLRVGARDRSSLLKGALTSLRLLAPDIRATVTWVSVPSLDKLTFQTTEGLEVVFGGPEEAAKKNFVIKEILRKAKAKVVHINVTAPDNPVVRKVNT